MFRYRIRAAVLAAAVVLAACGMPGPAAQAASAPAVPVIADLALQDATVMQSFAYDPVHRVWVFAQLTAGRPASAGDLTLTRVSASGARLGWMHLQGFGHGLSIGVEPCGASTCVWTEVHGVAEPARGWALAGTYGDQVARFGWRSGATLTPAAVERFGVNAGAPEQTPSVNAAAGLIAVQYWSTALHSFRWAVYQLSQFRQHRYTALARFTVPAALARNGLTEQGWALASRATLVNWQGEAKPADDATLSWVSTSGAVTAQVRSTAGAGLSYREPEGTAVAAGQVCTGFASGAAGARRANVYCTSQPS